MEVRIDIKLKPEDMFRFHMYYAYHSSQGWMGILFGIVGVGAGLLTFGTLDLFYSVAYIVLGIAFFVYIPVVYYFRFVRAGKQLKENKVMSNVLHYTLSGEGVTVETDVDTGGETKAMLPWKQVYKAVTAKGMLMIFSTRQNAYLLPKEQIGDRLPEVAELLKKHLPAHRLQYRW